MNSSYTKLYYTVIYSNNVLCIAKMRQLLFVLCTVFQDTSECPIVKVAIAVHWCTTKHLVHLCVWEGGEVVEGKADYIQACRRTCYS